MIASFKRNGTVHDHNLEARIASLTTKRSKIPAVRVADEAGVTPPAGFDAANAEPLMLDETEVTEVDVAVAEPAVGEAAATPPEPSVDQQVGFHLASAREELIKRLSTEISAEQRTVLRRRDLAKIVDTAVGAHFARQGATLNAAIRRGFVTEIMEELSASTEAQAASSPSGRHGHIGPVESARRKIHPLVLEHMDVSAAVQMPRVEFETRLSSWVSELLAEKKIQLNFSEQRQLVDLLIAEMVGLGPLDPLMADESVSDIMVNGASQVYVERRGKVELTDVKFRDEPHLMNVCNKIVTWVGRRIDESRPWVDARLPDGSRVNIIIPPLAVDGISLSIRKFSKRMITLDTMAMNGSISPAMATLLKIAARCRLNILISGGTGSGKTTLLNALSRMIDGAERTVTIEDAAELQLQQPHVVRLETRTANLEGSGEVAQRDLLKNALRMRPDRIIIGECRGEEALDMLQAMNTGHDGSMSTIHANNPREALSRLETMIGMAGTNLPAKAVRTQIASAIDLICQVSRMRDGQRRVTHVTEVVGMEGEIITTQDLFTYEFKGLGSNGKLQGFFQPAAIRPMFLPRAEYFGLDQVLLEAL